MLAHQSRFGAVFSRWVVILECRLVGDVAGCLEVSALAGSVVLATTRAFVLFVYVIGMISAVLDIVRRLLYNMVCIVLRPFFAVVCIVLRPFFAVVCIILRVVLLRSPAGNLLV